MNSIFNLMSSVTLGMIVANSALAYESRCPNCKIIYHVDEIEKHLDLTIDPNLDLVYICEKKVNKLVSWLSK